MLLSSICAKEASSLGKSPLTLCINCRRVGTKFSQCCFGTSPQAPCRGCSWAVGCWTGWPSPLFTVREPGWEASSHTHAFTPVPQSPSYKGGPTLDQRNTFLAFWAGILRGNSSSTSRADLELSRVLSTTRNECWPLFNRNVKKWLRKFQTNLMRY